MSKPAATPTHAREHCRTMEDVAQFLTRLKFRRRLFGGVDEADVWQQIETLHREYEAVFAYQEIRFAALLEAAEKRHDED